MTMPPERSGPVRLACCLALALAGATFSRGATAQDEQEALETDDISGELEVPLAQASIDPSIIELGFPAELGALQRPAVAFKHAVHTEALNLDKEGCTKCHGFNEQGKLDPKLEEIDYSSDRDTLMHQYHDLCIGCHRERSKQDLSGGPATPRTRAPVLRVTADHRPSSRGSPPIRRLSQRAANWTRCSFIYAKNKLLRATFPSL